MKDKEANELCESCKNKAKYIVDGIYRCKNCAAEYIDEVYKDLTLIEKAQLLQIDILNIK